MYRSTQHEAWYRRQGAVLCAAMAIVAVACSPALFGQGVGINGNGATPHASAMLDIDVGAVNPKRGLLIPRVTQVQRLAIPAPADGLLVYQTNLVRGFYYYDGTAAQWLQLGTTGWGLTGNAGTNPATHFLGTTDAQALSIRTNNVERMRITTLGQWVPMNTGRSVLIGENAGAAGAASPGATDDNVYIGFHAGLNSNGTTANTAVGGIAAKDLTSGHSNTALGYDALRNTSSGHSNTAIGAGSGTGPGFGYSEYTAVGYATYALTSGTALGAFAEARATGATAIGHGAIAQFDNSTAIGQGATTTAADQVRIGTAATTSIGGYAPWSNLSDIRFKKDVRPFAHGLDLVLALRPIQYRLDVEALHRHVREGEAPAPAPANGSSDILRIGFSAQEMLATMQALGIESSTVHVPTNPRDHYAVAYSDLIPVLVNAVKELHAMEDSLQQDIQELKLRLERLEGTLQAPPVPERQKR